MLNLKTMFGRAPKIADAVASVAEAEQPSGPQVLAQSVPHLFESVPEQNAVFQDLWREYDARHGSPHDPMRVLQFMYNVGIANDAEAGDYIELGTHQGLTARLIYKLMDPARTLYLLDTYEGFKEKDLVVERKIYDNAWHEGNFLPTSPEMVANYVGGGTAPENVVPIKGWFPETYAGLEDRKWRFVHIDFDLYQPIRSAVDILWPQLVPGGVMVVHDYGCFGFPGAKVAVDEFAAQIGMTPTHFGDRWGSVVFVKPKKPAARQ